MRTPKAPTPATPASGGTSSPAPAPLLARPHTPHPAQRRPSACLRRPDPQHQSPTLRGSVSKGPTPGRVASHSNLGLGRSLGSRDATRRAKFKLPAGLWRRAGAQRRSRSAGWDCTRILRHPRPHRGGETADFVDFAAKGYQDSCASYAVPSRLILVA